MKAFLMVVFFQCNLAWVYGRCDNILMLFDCLLSEQFPWKCNNPKLFYNTKGYINDNLSIISLIISTDLPLISNCWCKQRRWYSPTLPILKWKYYWTKLWKSSISIWRSNFLRQPTIHNLVSFHLFIKQNVQLRTHTIVPLPFWQ
jgi:hypothetical protein